MSLIVKNLFFSYKNQPILKNLSLRLEKGEIGSLIGASGSGKSTLFKVLTGLLPVQQGEITIQESNGSVSYENIAYMMQQDLLLPWRNVIDNVRLGVELGKHNFHPSSLLAEAFQLLKELGLSDYANHYPDELSGGMRQRVSLARALLQKRPLLLLDEPFGALDIGLREQMYQLLRQIKEKHQTTILMITHDFRDALSLSDRLFLLAEGQLYKEWKINSHFREDFHQMGLLQQELQDLLIYYAESSKL